VPDGLRCTRRDALKLGAGTAVLAALGCRAEPEPRSGRVLSVEPLPAWTLGNGRPMRRPGGLALLSDGRLACAESGRHRLRLFDPAGAVAATHGEAGSHPGQWNDPGDVAVYDATANRLAVTDRANGRVVLIGADGSDPVPVGGLGIDDDRFMGPAGIAVGPTDPDRGGRLLVVADARNRRVKALRADGTPRAFFWAGNTPAPGPRLPVDVAMLPSGVCAAADPLAGALFTMQLVTADVRVAFAEPGAAAIPETPTVLATKRFGFRSRLRITTAGDSILLADKLGLAVLDSALTVTGIVPAAALGVTGTIRPGGLAYDPRGETLYLSDAASGAILRARVRLS
jgi:DNA-binding beta-propeller fold protein YncE